MIFLNSYRPSPPPSPRCEGFDKKNEEWKIQRWLLDAEMRNNNSGYNRDRRSPRPGLKLKVVRNVIIVLIALALLMYGLHKLNCQYKASRNPLKPTVLNPCSWIDLETTKNPSSYFTFYNVSVTVTPQTPCDKGTNLLIIVYSSPGNKKARKSIRDTWGSIRAGPLSDLKFKVVFLLGRSFNPKRKLQESINEEINIYDDVIVTNVVDTYANLSLKSAAMLHWVITFCPDVNYVMKTDDDVYVNERLLMKFAGDLPFKTKTIYGHLIKNGLPHRDQSDKWYMSKAMYPNSRYPDFVSGSSYLITGDVIRPLCFKTITTPLLPLEDVYLTGICAEKAGIRLVHHPGMNNDLPERLCMVKKYTTVHFIKPGIMRFIWDSMRRGSDGDCEEDNTTEISYTVRK